ncbi:MAG: transposase [Deltaproteobacteria bacterium]|nr:transposase [Deltaproteobacteria bacterium]
MRVLSPAFSHPSFVKALILALGWIQTRGVHAVTQALVETGSAGRRHHASFHRFFSRDRWDPDVLGHLMFEKIVAWLVEPGAPIHLVLDDTLTAKKGPRIFGIGAHLDAVKSSKKHRVFSFGHVWVVLSVVVHLRWSRRPWALPILFRLYRTETTARRRHGRYFKKTEFGRQMLDTVRSWMPEATFYLTADIEYSNGTLLRGLGDKVHMIGSLKHNAALHAPPEPRVPGQRGRPRKKGDRLPTPLALTKSTFQPWRKIQAFIYGQVQAVEYKTLDALWYGVAGDRLLRIVIVRVSRGAVPVRTFFSTDCSMDVPTILELYAGRWSTEVCFRDLKQLLGFGDSQARGKTAVERTAPFIGYVYDLLVLWFASHGTDSSPLATPPLRPWYPHKSGFCFADILRAAQRVLDAYDIFDLSRAHEALSKKLALHRRGPALSTSGPPLPHNGESRVRTAPRPLAETHGGGAVGGDECSPSPP